MKRVTLVVLILAMALFAAAQQQTPSNNNGSAAPATQSAPAQGSQPAAGAAQPSQGRGPIQAKTQAEFDAFNAAKANTDLAALEKGADDFAAKFPDSDLRLLLYENLMTQYQQANNSAKMEEIGRKIIAIDPDQPDALLAAAESTMANTRDTDLDKDQKLAEAAKNAQHALQTIDTDLSIPAGTPQDKIDAFKQYLKSDAYSILGTIAFKKENYADAESNYRKSLDAFASQPDAVVVLRLALSLDKQNKYPEALEQANKAVELTQENTTVGTYARRERDRLVQLTGGKPSTPAATTPATAPSTAPATTPSTAPKPQ